MAQIEKTYWIVPLNKSHDKIADNHPIPTRKQLVEFISTSPGKVGKREIARAFGLHGSDKILLKKLLKELEQDGLLDRRKKGFHQSGQLPPVIVADIVGRDRDGELIARPTEWDDEHGPIPSILVTASRKPKGRQPAPGIGNRALLRVDCIKGSEKPVYSGRIIKILPIQKTQLLGLFRSMPDGGGRFVPVNKKDRGKEIPVNPGDENGARDGDLVTVGLIKSGRFGVPHARIKERLGSVKSERAVSLIAIHAHDIPYIFPEDVLAESDKAVSASLSGREDWRTLPLVTIDPPDAKDHDDAVHAARDPDPKNPGGFVLTVAIADVASYVRPGSALDREALKRGNSVYFPDRVVPMLPERISNDLCSLRPNEARPALAVQIVVTADGRKKTHKFHRIMMRSAAKLSYEQAQAAIDGRPDETTAPLLEPVLRPLWDAYACVKQARDARGPLDLDLPERKIVLTKAGHVDRIIIPPRLDAHRLIEEFMILANVAAAESLETAGIPLIYRVHDEPSLEKMQTLEEVLASVGLKLPKQGALRSGLFNRILATVHSTRHQTFINEMVLRSQAQAEYSAENAGHFGLNLRRYAHFTSPIRRYADLIVHRALIRSLKAGDDGLPSSTTRQDLAETSALISATERRAMAAERETVDRLIAHHLADRVGATFEGQIAGVTKAGLFVRLFETGADGFIPANSLGADYYAYDERHMALVGERTGETYQLGDTVSVKLAEVIPAAGAIRFDMISEGRFDGPTPTRSGRKGRSTKKDIKKRPKAPSKRLTEIS